MWLVGSELDMLDWQDREWHRSSSVHLGLFHRGLLMSSAEKNSQLPYLLWACCGDDFHCTIQCPSGLIGKQTHDEHYGLRDLIIGLSHYTVEGGVRGLKDQGSFTDQPFGSIGIDGQLGLTGHSGKS